MKNRIGVISGDGIGVEVMSEAVKGTGIAHELGHAAKDEPLGDHGSSGPFLRGKTGRLEAAAAGPRGFQGGRRDDAMAIQDTGLG